MPLLGLAEGQNGERESGEAGDGRAYIGWGRSGQRNATGLSGGFNGDDQSRGSLYQITAALSRA